jgi:hypothetical protein
MVKQYKKCYCTVWPFNMGPVGCPETSVRGVTFHKASKASNRPQRLAGISGRNRVQSARSHSDCLLFFPPSHLVSFFLYFSRCDVFSEHTWCYISGTEHYKTWSFGTLNNTAGDSGVSVAGTPLWALLIDSVLCGVGLRRSKSWHSAASRWQTATVFHCSTKPGCS